MTVKTRNPKLMGCSTSSSKREVCNNTNLPQETRKISNKQSNLTPKAIRERRTKKDTHVQEAKRVANKMNPNRPTPGYIIIKMAKVNNKERILKAAREKQSHI